MPYMDTVNMQVRPLCYGVHIKIIQKGASALDAPSLL